MGFFFFIFVIGCFVMALPFILVFNLVISILKLVINKYYPITTPTPTNTGHTP